MKEIKKCIDIINEKCINIEDGDPFFRDKEIITYPLSDENVIKIYPEDSYRTLSFIDGGNNTIISTPNFCVGLVNVYFNLFFKNKKMTPSSIPSNVSFFVIAIRNFENDNSEMYGHLIPFDEEHLKYLPDENKLMFNDMDESIRNGIFSAPLSSIINIARRFAEWKFAECVLHEELNHDDMLIRDGTLQTGITNESYYSNKVFKIANKKNILVSGFAKSTNMFTTTGNSLAYVIKKIGNEMYKNEPWYYYPIADNIPYHKGEIYFLNLHPLSKTTYRYEILKEQAIKMNESELNTYLYDLFLNANDYSFPGYPYGLIDADKYGAVSKRESNYYRTIFLSLIKERKEIENLLSSTNAHDIINRIRNVV